MKLLNPTYLSLILITVFLSFGSCKKKKNDEAKPAPVIADNAALMAINNQIAGNWRYTEFNGTIVFHDPKNSLKSKPISVSDMLDSFNQKFGNTMKTDSLSFKKTNDLGGLIFGKSNLIVFCPYASSGKADGDYTTYKIISEGGVNKVQIQWTYWNKNGAATDTTHVVPYQLPITKIDNINLTMSINQASFDSYSAGTEQYGNTILLVLFQITFPDEYKKLGYAAYTSADYTTYNSQIYEITSPINIKMTKIP